MATQWQYVQNLLSAYRNTLIQGINASALDFVFHREALLKMYCWLDHPYQYKRNRHLDFFVSSKATP